MTKIFERLLSDGRHMNAYMLRRGEIENPQCGKDSNFCDCHCSSPLIGWLEPFRLDHRTASTHHRQTAGEVYFQIGLSDVVASGTSAPAPEERTEKFPSTLLLLQMSLRF